MSFVIYLWRDLRVVKAVLSKEVRLKLRVLEKPRTIIAPEWSFSTSLACSCYYVAVAATSFPIFVRSPDELGQSAYTSCWVDNRWACAEGYGCKAPARAVEKCTLLMPKSKVEVMLSRQKEEAYVSSICLDLQPSYASEVVAEPYPVGYVTR